ncbi:MAG: ATPase domain-containing protein [Nitrososphaerota archaeon]
MVKYGEPGVYASFGENKEKFYGFMKGFGMDFEKLEGKSLFRFLSLPTMLEAGIGGIFAEILETVDAISARRLVIDPFTALSQGFKSEAEARVFLPLLLLSYI